MGDRKAVLETIKYLRHDHKAGRIMTGARLFSFVSLGLGGTDNITHYQRDADIAIRILFSRSPVAREFQMLKSRTLAAAAPLVDMTRLFRSG
jgi:hypothetical protein